MNHAAIRASETAPARDLTALRHEIRQAADSSGQIRTGQAGHRTAIGLYILGTGLCFARLGAIESPAAVIFLLLAFRVAGFAIQGIAAGLAAGYRGWHQYRLRRTAASLSPEEAHRVLRSLGLHRSAEPSRDLFVLAEPLIARAFAPAERPTELVPASICRGSEPTPTGPVS